jgi:gliding motility-associated-like protein
MYAGNRIALSLGFLLSFTIVFAQGGETSWWYFGRNAGVDFTSGSPVANLQGQISVWEGTASISNQAGNLLFYTDGMTVWNANHAVMPNGFGLLGHNSSTQSAVIVPRPGSTSEYYIFTTPDRTDNHGVRFSIVDMSLNNGMGVVTFTKNVLLYSPTTEKLCAVRHCNGEDIWVITRHWGTNEFRAFLVTSTGVNTTPVVSSIGIVNTGQSDMKIGYMKVSPIGNKLAMGVISNSSGDRSQGRVQLFDFDNSTGVVSNEIDFGVFARPYGVEFSPNGSLLYVTTEAQPWQVKQYNLCAGSPTGIVSSVTSVGTSASGQIGTLQLGRDGKIYVARRYSTYLGVINEPNILGVGCNYVDNGLSLGGRQCEIGLPNFNASYFNIYRPEISIHPVSCLDYNFSFTHNAPPQSCTAANVVQSVNWNFGNPSSGSANTSTSTNPSHSYQVQGSYEVTLVIQYQCRLDTVKKTVTVGLDNFSLSHTNVTCPGMQDGTATVVLAGSTGVPPYTYSWSTGDSTKSISGLSTGNYTVTVTDFTGCQWIDSVNIDVAGSSTIIHAGPDTVLCLGDTLQLWATGGVVYIWEPTLGLSDPHIASPLAFPTSSVVYTVTAIDSNGCLASATVQVTITNGPVANAGPDIVLLTGQSGILQGSGGISAEWSPPAGLSDPFIYNPIANPINDVTLYVLTVWDEFGCSDTDTVLVVRLQYGEPSLPNAFTPNGDGLNDVFGPLGEGFSVLYFRVYNRWGELIFESNDIQNHWDGTFKGEPVPNGVYAWVLNWANALGNEDVMSGNVTVIR